MLPTRICPNLASSLAPAGSHGFLWHPRLASTSMCDFHMQLLWLPVTPAACRHLLYGCPDQCLFYKICSVLTVKIHSMSMGYEALQNGTERFSERIHTVETDNQNLLKSYNKPAGTTFLLENNLHAIHMIKRMRRYH